MENTRKPHAVLIYDGQCPVCREAVRWIKEHEKEGAFETLPCQSEERKTRFPSMEERVCMEAMQLVLPDGTILPGEQALPEIVKRLEGYGPASEIFSLPGSGAVSRAFYRWFAANRYDIARILFPRRDKGKNGP